ncbi:hypothetical protein [Amycolatopsis sp. NPDC051903]|uniref:hypothetical protein n=1 Tax=Amycolatopsis sp. NPDC051903 TaxID=3363936 RepID=UPI0037A20D46
MRHDIRSTQQQSDQWCPEIETEGGGEALAHNERDKSCRRLSKKPQVRVVELASAEASQHAEPQRGAGQWGKHNDPATGH